MTVQSIPRLQSLPLAWGYACKRIESRACRARYQPGRASELYLEALRLFGQALKAGGAEAQAARAANRIIREDPSLNDPGAVATLVAEAGGL